MWVKTNKQCYVVFIFNVYVLSNLLRDNKQIGFLWLWHLRKFFNAESLISDCSLKNVKRLLITELTYWPNMRIYVDFLQKNKSHFGAFQMQASKWSHKENVAIAEMYFDCFNQSLEQVFINKKSFFSTIFFPLFLLLFLFLLLSQPFMIV